MTPDEQRLLDKEFEAIKILIRSSQELQKAKDENIELKLKGLSGLLMAQMDMQKITADNDRKMFHETLVNTKESIKRITDLEQKNSRHVIHCPQAPRVTAIEENLIEYDIIKKYPKLAGGTLIGTMVLAILAFLNSLK